MKDAAHIRPLTSLRFFAALWVVVYSYWPKLSAAAAPAFVSRGYLGVELFFVLSGFILCHVYLRGWGEKRFSYGGFLWARLARVYPLHLATLISIGVLAFGARMTGAEVDPNVTSLPALPANLLLLHAWGFAPVAGWNHPSWSISAEWFAYLTFPFSAFLAWTLRDRPRLGLALSLIVIALAYPLFEAVAGFRLTEATIVAGAVRIVPCFLYGCALHGAWRAGLMRRFAWPLTIAALAVVIGGACLGAPDGLMVAAFGALIAALAGLSERGWTLLSQGPFVYLGEISYALYMIAVPWMFVFVHGAQKALHLTGETLPLPLWLAFVASAVPVAALAHHAVEAPARTALKALAKRAKRRTAAYSPA